MTLQRKPVKPFTIGHRLRWYLHSEKYLARYVHEKLGLDENYWLFLLGVNNSGTTLLRRILETHTQIRGLPREGHALTNALPNPIKLGCQRLWTKQLEQFRPAHHEEPGQALRVKYDWSFYYPQKKGILFEKSPPNTVRAPWLQANFKPCRFIALVRNPYAVCEGIRRRQNASIEEAAEHWLTANRCLFEDIDSLEKILWFRYEEFCAQPQLYQKKMLDFLNLSQPFNKHALRVISSHSLDGSTRGVADLNAKSFANLSNRDLQDINRILGDFPETLGYERRTKQSSEKT